MKTNNVVQFMAGIVVFASLMFFVSCNKEEFELPDVIESEVLDEGLSEDVKSEVSDLGAQMSYESWIVVKGQTRAAFENTVTVDLMGEANNIETVCEVPNWNIGDYQIFVSGEVENQVTDKFVTKTDSVTVFTVKFENFSFSYRLKYQVGVYDDHVTRQTMPYYYFGNITDNGGELIDADSYIDGQYAYARKIYRHSIDVDFAGQKYNVQANITLRREIGPANEAFILRSEIVDRNIESTDDTGYCISKIKVHSKYSDGQYREENYSGELRLFSEPAEPSGATCEKKIEDIEFLGYEIVEKQREYAPGNQDCIIQEIISEECVLSYSGFQVKIPFVRLESIFDNIVLRESLNGDAFSKREVSVEPIEWQLRQENGNNRIYDIRIVVKMKMGSLSSTGEYVGWVKIIH